MCRPAPRCPVRASSCSPTTSATLRRWDAARGIDMPAKERHARGRRGRRLMGHEVIPLAERHLASGDRRRRVLLRALVALRGRQPTGQGRRRDRPGRFHRCLDRTTPHFEVHPKPGAPVDGFPLLLGLCAEETNTPAVTSGATPDGALAGAIGSNRLSARTCGFESHSGHHSDRLTTPLVRKHMWVRIPLRAPDRTRTRVR